MEQNLLKVKNKRINKIRDILNNIKNRVTTEKIFLAMVIPIGLLFLVFLMPFYAPDEYAHIVKSYDVSQGNFVTKDATGEGEYRVKVPQDFTQHSFANFKNYADLKQAIKQPTNYKETVEIYTDAQANFGIIYLPSAIGFALGRLFNINIMLATYLARLCNFIFFIILGYFAIKIIPIGKIVACIYMLTPMFLQQATSLSPDSMINIVIIFYIAYILKLAFGQKDMRKRDIAFVIASGIFIAMAKYVYLPILGLMLILIKNKNINKKKLAIVIIVCYIMSIIVALGCIKFSSRYTDQRDYIQNNNINGAEQVANIVENPEKFFIILKDNIITQRTRMVI